MNGKRIYLKLQFKLKGTNLKLNSSCVELKKIYLTFNSSRVEVELN